MSIRLKGTNFSTNLIKFEIEVSTDLYIYEVGLHGSIDDWCTIFTCQACYVKKTAYNRHIFNVSLTNVDKLIFALYAKIVNSETVWDNNHATNYTIHKQKLLCHNSLSTDVKITYGDKKHVVFV
jgi:hypothetical protein